MDNSEERKAITRYVLWMEYFKDAQPNEVPAILDSLAERGEGIFIKYINEGDTKLKSQYEQEIELIKSLVNKGRRNYDDASKEIEEDFKKNIKSHSEKEGIYWNAWRKAGVPVSILEEAGIQQDKRKVAKESNGSKK